jgi:hypothetical protein
LLNTSIEKLFNLIGHWVELEMLKIIMFFFLFCFFENVYFCKAVKKDKHLNKFIKYPLFVNF